VLEGGIKLRVSDALMLLPEGYRDGARVDPEKMFVATIASAHMLSWLHIAFSYGIEVESYHDAAVVWWARYRQRFTGISEVILNPRITYNERSSATPAAQAKMHELAREQCFIANSIKTKVTVLAG
jgi:organic hydroperoxide reductase OsmC/OhrA